MKKIHANTGNAHALKDGTGVGSNVQKVLERAGIDWNSVKPKMEEYSSLIKWNEDSMAYMAAKTKAMKDYLELYAQLGNKGIDFGMEIARISYLLDQLERRIIEEGGNPLENRDYQSAMKLKKELMIEYSKLNIDLNRAKVDYIDKKSRNPKFEEFEMTVEGGYDDHKDPYKGE
jgi:hypothetical protein